MESLETERTFLRRLSLEDLEAIFEMESDPEAIKYTPIQSPLNKEVCRERLLSKINIQEEFKPFGFWSALSKETNDYIGMFLLVPKEDSPHQFGFILRQSEWGKGYATECSRALLEKAFLEKGLDKVVACTDPDNFASKKVLKKLGFVEESRHENIKGFEDGLDYFLKENKVS